MRTRTAGFWTPSVLERTLLLLSSPALKSLERSSSGFSISNKRAAHTLLSAVPKLCACSAQRGSSMHNSSCAAFLELPALMLANAAMSVEWRCSLGGRAPSCSDFIPTGPLWLFLLRLKGFNFSSLLSFWGVFSVSASIRPDLELCSQLTPPPPCRHHSLWKLSANLNQYK